MTSLTIVPVQPGSLTLTAPYGLTSLSVFNIKDYGATLNGSDETAKFAALAADLNAAGGGIVIVPAGTLGVSANIASYITTPCLIMGAGTAGVSGDIHYPTRTPVSKIKWVGASAATMVKPFHLQGFWLQDIELDMNQLAGVGLDFSEAFLSGTRGVVSIINGPRNGVAGAAIDSIGLQVEGTATTISGWNRFHHLWIEASTLVKLTGDTGTGNDATLNKIDFVGGLYGSTTGNTDGFICDVSDANQINFYYAFRSYGTGYDLRFNPYARKNVFGYVHGNTGAGIYVDTPNTSTWRNRIEFYDRGDGGPAPSGPGVATYNLLWDDSGAGTQSGLNIPGFGSTFGVGTLSPSLTNSGLGIHVKTSDSTTPEVKLEGIGNSSNALFEALGKTAGGVTIQYEAGATPSNVTVGAATNHALLFRTNNVERGRFEATGEFRLGGPSGPEVLTGSGVPSSSSPTGSIYLRDDGGAGSTLYVREGSSWVAK